MRGRKKVQQKKKNHLATAKVTADVTNTEWIFGKVKNDAYLNNFLLLTDNSWNRTAAQGFGGVCIAAIGSPGLRFWDEDPPCSFPGLPHER